MKYRRRSGRQRTLFENYLLLKSAKFDAATNSKILQIIRRRHS